MYIDVCVYIHSIIYTFFTDKRFREHTQQAMGDISFSLSVSFSLYVSNTLAPKDAEVKFCSSACRACGVYVSAFG